MEAVQIIISKLLYSVLIFKEIVWLSGRALKSGELSFKSGKIGQLTYCFSSFLPTLLLSSLPPSLPLPFFLCIVVSKIMRGNGNTLVRV